MSIWKKHIGKLRKEVRSYYDEYLKAQGEVKKAQLDLEEAQREERQVEAKHHTGIYVELAKNETRARELILQTKKDDLKRVNDRRFDLLDKSKKIRAELSGELDDNYVVNPADIDANTMTLVSSGILNHRDDEKLYSEASKSQNVTMMRLLGKSARDMAEKTTDSEARSVLNSIYSASISGKNDELQHYDEYSFSLSLGTGNPESIYRSSENPAMYEYFLDTTADMGEEE